jgi:hypothetical protein
VTLEDRTTAEDQAKAIDWAIEQNAQHGGPYQGRFDIDRMAAAGNSCGGITSLTLAGADSRVRAVFVLSGSSVGPNATRDQAAAVMDKVSQPVGFVVGGPEDIAADQAAQDYDLLAKGVPGYLARRVSGDHPTVSTDPDILSDVAEIGVHWLDLVFFGNELSHRRLIENPCGPPHPDVWRMVAKNLDSLVRVEP